jgi:uncharacterized protein (DUF1501 family)
MKRRDFIKTSCSAMGSTTLLSTLANLGMINGAVAAPMAPPASDYKALVCILLSGGIDSYNVLIPRGTTASDNGFNDYKAIRTDLAFANATDLLALTNPQCNSHRGIACQYQSFGIHNQMPGVQQLFNNGKLSFMANIGTLIEPVLNKTEYNAGVKKIPLGLYSHSDQQMQWQTSVPQSRTAVGYGGRIADLLNAQNSNQNVSMNISLAGKNTFQRGQNISEYAIKNNISPANVGLDAFPSWWNNAGLISDLRNATVDNMVAQNYQNILEKTYSANTVSAKASFETFKEALKRVPSFTTSMPTTDLGKDLSAVAKVMSVRTQLGANRQIFFIDFGGWDMHDNMVSGMNTRLPMVSQALKSFYDLTVEMGIADKVTTFTISDFARTVTSNGLGSDHAWGGNQMVMGGAVNGGRVFGSFPKMNVTTYDRNVSFRGNFIPAVSTDEFYAELALWYGVSPQDLCYVLPNIGNFYNYSAGNYPVGFMNFAGTTISNVDYPQSCLTY